MNELTNWIVPGLVLLGSVVWLLTLIWREERERRGLDDEPETEPCGESMPGITRSGRLVLVCDKPAGHLAEGDFLHAVDSDEARGTWWVTPDGVYHTNEVLTFPSKKA